jgi:hypothetical protein
VSVGGGEAPHGAAHGSDAPPPRQGAASPAGRRRARALGIAALAGWALLATAGGGIDLGDGLPGPGPTGAFLALALGAPAAALAALGAWRTAALRAGATRCAIGAAAGLAAWSALSILWAAGPDLAWIDANRAAITACALVVGVGVAALVPRAPRAFGLGLAAAAALPVGVALLTKVFPALAGDDRDLARLSDPVGYWNALALIAVLAIPGLLWIAAGPAPEVRGWGAPAAGAGMTIVLTAVLLTYSRGGLVAAVVAVAVCLILLPGPWRGLAAVAGGVAGAVLPAVHALTDPALSTDLVAVAAREGPGLGLGWRLVAGAALGALVAGALVRASARVPIDPGRARRMTAVTCAVLVVLVAAATVASLQGRDWVGDRWSEVRGDDGDAVANDPGRIVSAASNQRVAWWGQAWRGFTDSPLIGQGAGGFRLVHLQERTTGEDRLLTTETHDLALRTLSGTGLVGMGLLATLLGALAVGARRALTRHRTPELALPLAVLAAFVVQALVDWSWAIPALTVPALAAGGVILAAAAPGAAPGARRPGGAAVALIAAAVMIAVASALLPWWSVRLNDAADRALAEDRPGLALERAEAAVARNPLSIAPLRTKAAALRALDEPGRAMAVQIEMTRVQPDNPATWRALARIYGSGPRADEAWRRVLELSPQDTAARAALGL